VGGASVGSSLVEAGLGGADGKRPPRVRGNVDGSLV